MSKQKSSSNLRGGSKGSKPSSSRPARTPSKTQSVRPATPRPSGAATSPSPAEAARQEREARLSRLNSSWNRVAGIVALNGILSSLEDVNGDINGLEHRIGQLRARGYSYEQGWEERAQRLRQQWPNQYRAATRALQQERTQLNLTVDQTRDLLNRAQRNASLIDSAERQVNDLERQVRDAERRVEHAFNQVSDEVARFEHDLRRVERMLDVFEGAQFRLFPDEHPVSAVEAEWLPAGTDPIPGQLFITNSRLLFEQRQEVVTKRVLFIKTAKETVQELLWQAPIGSTELLDMQDEGGFLKARKELVTLRVDGDGPPQVTLNLKGMRNEDWVKVLRRAVEGKYDLIEEVVVLEEEAAEAEIAVDAALPTTCPACGAGLPTIYKGMHQVSCEYCGRVVSL